MGWPPKKLLFASGAILAPLASPFHNRAFFFLSYPQDG